jgi:hypothetical protein
MILDSSILVAFERRRFDLERLLADHTPPAIAAVTAAELLIGVERADTPEPTRIVCSKPLQPNADHSFRPGSGTPVRSSFRRVG